MKFWLWVGSILFLLLPTTTRAVNSPLQVSNNKFGIHIISPVESEVENAARLVNSSGGDWGYVTFVIQRNDLNRDKWQEFFNHLENYHLIPIVRIATELKGDSWVRPDEIDAREWADFLGSLVWPMKNRYVVIYNEPNHSKEWGNRMDPAEYALVLQSTIDILKVKSVDFFVLNAGLDASAPHKPPQFYDEEQFLKDMEASVPGIFNKLDGWVSHSYPNPGFSGSPKDTGRGTIRGYEWELDVLKKLGIEKDLLVFITETGWQHADGQKYKDFLPSVEKLAEYFKTAFEGPWNDPRIIAVTPFVLDYTHPPFDHFSWRRVVRSGTEFYPHYEVMVSLPKIAGKPEREPFVAQKSLNLFEIVMQKIIELLQSG